MLGDGVWEFGGLGVWGFGGFGVWGFGGLGVWSGAKSGGRGLGSGYRLLSSVPWCRSGTYHFVGYAAKLVWQRERLLKIPFRRSYKTLFSAYQLKACCKMYNASILTVYMKTN